MPTKRASGWRHLLPEHGRCTEMTVQKILRWWIPAFLFLPALAAAQIGPGTQVTVAGTVTTIPASLTFPTQAITAQDTGSTSTTQADGQAAITGTPTAGSVATFTVPGGYGTASVVITGTFTGTTTIEVSRDGGTTYIAKGAHLIGSTITAASYIAPFQAEGSIVGVTNIRVRATATWSGTATVRVIVTGLVEQIYVGNQVIIANPVTGFLGNLVLSAATSTAVNT